MDNGIISAAIYTSVVREKKTLGETALTKRPNLAAYATLISYSIPKSHASQLCISENHSTSESMISSK
jgi:hypothetical protein